MYADSREQTTTVPLPKCASCGEPIGVYEPLVRANERSVRVTSLVAEAATITGRRRPPRDGELHYHVDCYVAAS